eukprot:CAMPEP_0176470910 /NCGR_PEP_ID=MMETSP0127-20121128/40776_1 /TAXON_ID=938130 /ORGANISM="Platyophrya macrostoma, Strain WH" /LENGTH=143 /DNA_ID=CAMNT_0017865373 /DNA_START=41 /DNA_END=468 /DNA_ORIENTATION=-
MHGQRKVKEIYDDAHRRATEEKIASFRSLYETVFTLRKESCYTRDALKLLDALLEVSPEQYTLFGYRRDILLHLWRMKADHRPSSPSRVAAVPSTDADTEVVPASSIDEDLDREYLLNTKIILKDFKVYSAFVHRRWILERIG